MRLYKDNIKIKSNLNIYVKRFNLKKTDNQ